ncbi:DUF6301 family protein [Nocardia tengchongensis]|uniref:DUF6301 family protein n=1 Tax=Nocardia tengchongensis TaxID=2055889 RepID=UPI00369AF445
MRKPIRSEVGNAWAQRVSEPTGWPDQSAWFAQYDLTVRADYDGADRIASAAAEFDWTWTAGDIQRFCDVLGWRIAKADPSAVTLVTNISVEYPEAFAYFDSEHGTGLGDSDRP